MSVLPRNSSGLFITLEGGEGAGKSTLREFFVRQFESAGHSVVPTRAPGGTELGQQIRTILLEQEQAPSKTAEMLLFLGDMAHQVDTVIRPALDAGQIVVCDRFLDSTVAYQGFGRGRPVDRIRMFGEVATGGLLPDVTLWVDVPVELGLRRKLTAEDRNRMDDMAVDFHARVHAGFRDIAAAEPGRVVRVNGDQSRDEVCRDAWTAVEGLVAAAAAEGRLAVS